MGAGVQCGIREGYAGLWAACVGVRQQLPPLHTLTCMCVYTPVPCLLPPSRICSLIATGRLIVYCNHCLPAGSWAERLFPPLQPPALPCMWLKCSPWGTPQPTQHLGKVLQLGASCQPLAPYFSVDPLSMTQQVAVPYQRALGPGNTAPIVPYSSSRGCQGKGKKPRKTNLLP